MPSLKTFCYAFTRTIPVLCGYLFIGIAFGLLLQQSGYDARWALFISAFVYAGSAQFVIAGFLGTGISLVSVAIMTLSINCRHLFYGLSMLLPYRRMGRALPYMVFSLTDETYSLQVALTPLPEGVDEKAARLLVSLLDQLYWIAGSVLGAMLGQWLPFSLEGVDFAMTALFTVIFVDQWLDAATHIPALLGCAGAVLLLLFVGPERFLIPTLCVCCIALLCLKKTITKREEAAAHVS